MNKKLFDIMEFKREMGVIILITVLVCGLTNVAAASVTNNCTILPTMSTGQFSYCNETAINSHDLIRKDLRDATNRATNSIIVACNETKVRTLSYYAYGLCTLNVTMVGLHVRTISTS